MKEIKTERLLLRPFRESDYDDLFAFLCQLKDDEFEAYPGITCENGGENLQYRLGSNEFYAMELTGQGKVIGNIYCGSRDSGAKRICGRISSLREMKPACLSGRTHSYMPCCGRI